ncbi:hypothetical protein G6F57_023375 [Rhizopus arrhizus]|nr:hypothetical protein G6F31_020575 [Rhizopus arrhizus]KAG1386587.1 hypothetical protein G6F58_013803 [Rhizopus delemar]KAG1425517.1 hypothetical protein G6F57_023375 [Rhizopus arrhizus]
MTTQRLVHGNAVDVLQGRGQQYGSAPVRQGADAAVGVGTDAGDVVGVGVGAVAAFVQAIHVAGLRMRGQRGAQRGNGAGESGGADHA